MKWEYDVAYGAISNKERFKDIQMVAREETINWLNEWGEKDWELVHVLSVSSTNLAGETIVTTVMCVFKRPKVASVITREPTTTQEALQRAGGWPPTK